MVANMNNAGNMRPVGKSTGFQQFATPEQGVRAMLHDLNLKVSGNSNAMKSKYGSGYKPTLRNVIGTWAPENENDTAGYVDYVAKGSGIDPDAPLTPQDVQKFAPLMMEMEHGKKGAEKFKQYADSGQTMNDAGPQGDTFTVVLPDGTELEGVPIGTTKAQIAEKLKAKGMNFDEPKPAETTIPEEKGFFDRVGEDLSKRWGEGQEAVRDMKTGKITPAEMLLASTGKVVAGSVNDIAGEVITSVAGMAPDFVKEGVKSGVASILDTDIGKAGIEAAKQGAEAYKAFATQNPRAARNIESTVNIAALIPVSKGATLATDGAAPAVNAVGDIATKAGGALENAAKAQYQAKRGQFVKDLITPKQTSAVREAQVGRTMEKGRFNKKEVALSPQEQEIADVVANTGVSAKNTLQGNYNILQKEISDEAKTLASSLEKNDVFFPRKEFKAQFKGVMDNLQENPLLIGDAGKAAEKIIDKMNKLVDANKASASGLLKARKELDGWIKNLGREAAFDPKTETAISTALREIRQTTNDFIDAKAVDVGVKDSLRKQSLLFRAMDNIAPKAADEAPTALGRTAQKIYNKSPLKSDMGKAATALAATGALGTAATMIPQTMLAGGAIFGLGKAATSAGAKKALGKTLTSAGKTLKKAAK